MTLDEIAYNLLNLMRGGKSSQDEVISLSQIKFNVKHYRAMFLRRDFTKNGYISNHSEQDLGCVELKKVNATQCCNLPVTYDVFRTINKVPKAVRFNFEDALTYIGDVTGTKRIPLVSSQTIAYLPYDTYTKGKYKAYMIKDYLYIYNADGIDTINIRGVFEDPEEVAKFAKCEKGECYDPSSDPFPISMDMLNLINQGITGGELTLLSGTFSDTTNDRMQDPSSRGTNSGQQKQ